MTEEALYDDYVQRRNMEWGSSSSSSNPSNLNRFTPTNQQPSSSSPGDYSLKTDNAYTFDGYKQHDSQLGEDPITAVRTMRNNLRRQKIIDRESGRAVKSRLCDEAISELSRKENELIGLGKKKTDALMAGDQKGAERIRGQMNNVKEDAIRNNYTDLITDDPQIRAFGVESKWTRPHSSNDRPRPRMERTRSATPVETRQPSPVVTRQTSATPSERRSSASTRPSSTRQRPSRFVPDNLPVRERRTRSAARSPEGTVAPTMRMTQRPSSHTRSVHSAGRANSAVRNDYDVKKNERLKDYVHGSTNKRKEEMLLVDDPYKLPHYYGKCPYCDEINENFAKKHILEDHYGDDCKMLTNCRYCHKIVLIPQLTDHYVSRCDFLKDKKVRCKQCGLATEREDDEADVDHPLCRNRMAPSGAQWCPLCSVAVDDNRESWTKHLLKSNGCYNNPRASKLDPNAKQGLVPDTLYLTNKGGAGGPGGTGGAGGAGGAGGNQPPPVYHGPTVDMRGRRLIDADSLLQALKATQAKKKAQQKKRTQQIQDQEKKAQEQERREQEEEERKDQEQKSGKNK